VERTDWKHLKPAYFYITLVACLIVITSEESFSWRLNFLLIGLGVLSWALIEYGLHRFIFHYNARSVFGKKLLYAAHISHHDYPRASNQFFAGLVLSLPIATVYFLSAWVVTGSLHAASYRLSSGLFLLRMATFSGAPPATASSRLQIPQDVSPVASP
jgi:hypothetical protein